MTERRERLDEPGWSSFARRGQSTEERTPEDDSTQRFPARSGLRPDRGAPDQPREAPDEPREAPDEPREAPDEPREALDEPREAPDPQGYYGSGGSYGYGGSYEHDGQRGYDEPHERGAMASGEEFYEATGGFGHETGAHGRHELGHPGQSEHDGSRPNRVRGG